MVAPPTLKNNSEFEHVANLMQTFEKLLLQTTQQNSEIFYPNSPWDMFIELLKMGKIILMELNN